MFRPVLMVLLLMTLQSAGAPAIDGTLSDKEWTSAWKAKLEGGGEVRLLAEGKFLFVAIQGPRAPGLASICVAKGKTVRILHASAAIGDATFERWGDMWMRRKAFEWTLRDSPRDTVPSDDVKAEWLLKSGWLANASASGSVVREFKIYIKDVESIGVAFLVTKEPMELAYWPASMHDDCRSLKIPQGYLPDTARFDPTSWYQLAAK